MRNYMIKRLLLVPLTLLLVSFLIFFLVDLIPGDIVDAMASPSSGAVDRATVERRLGLDSPVYVQYGRWMGFLPQKDGSFSGVFQGNLGMSYMQRESVVKLVAQALPVTFELSLLALIIAQLIALPIGIYSAVRQDKWGDYIARSGAILCISMPSFWLGMMIIIFSAVWWNYMPPIMIIHFTDDPIGNLRMFIVPAIVLGMVMIGTDVRMFRTMMLEVLRQDYIRTAWAKGLSERVVLLRHALRNALIPIVTIWGIEIPILMGGTVIIERIFCLPGMGRLAIEALFNRDKLLFCGIVLVFSVLLVFINLVVDLSYGFLDPRVRYR